MKRYAIQTLSNGDWKDLQQYHDMQRSFALGAWSMLESHYNNVNSYRLVNYRDISKRSDLEVISKIHTRIVDRA